MSRSIAHRWVGAVLLTMFLTSLVASKSVATEVDPEDVAYNGVLEYLRQEEDERVEKEQWLRTDAAKALRQESLTAYTGLNASAARSVLLSKFGEYFGLLNGDPGRSLDNLQPVRAPDANTVVADDHGQNLLVDSTIPLYTSPDAAVQNLIDLDLDMGNEVYKSENPLVPVSLPKESDSAISFPESGLDLFMDTSSRAEPLKLGDKNLFYPSVAQDIDAILSPISTGLAMAFQIRSGNSPQNVPLTYSVPAGVHVELGKAGDIRFVSDRKILASMSAPVAYDAEGQTVPASYEIQGEDQIQIAVSYRRGDFTMPILVDPIIQENWQRGPEGNLTRSWWHGYNLDGMADWNWASNHAGFVSRTSCWSTQGRYCWGSGRGLYIYSKPNQHYGASKWGQFAYQAPGGPSSRILSASFGPQYMHRNNCTGLVLPHVYMGLYRPSNGQWVGLNTTGTGLAGSYFTSQLNPGGAGQGVKKAIVGMGSGSGVNIPCWREFLTGGALITLGDDGAPPEVTSVSPPTVWTKGNPIPPLGVVAKDSGLGVKAVEVKAVKESAVYDEDPVGVTWVTTNECDGTRSHPCPTEWDLNSIGGAIWHPEQMPSGQYSIQVRAKDIFGNLSPYRTSIVKVDHDVPEVSVGGTVFEPPDNTPAASPNIFITASDGEAALGTDEDPTAEVGGDQWESGVGWLVVTVDGQLRVNRFEPCAAGENCRYESSFALAGSDLSVGSHVVQATAVDMAGNVEQTSATYTVVNPLSSPVSPSGGSIVHVERVVMTPGSPAEKLDETWAVPGSLQGLYLDSEGSKSSRFRRTCAPLAAPESPCEEYSEATFMTQDGSNPTYDWSRQISDRLDDPYLPVITESLMPVSDELSDQVPSQQAPLSQILPAGSGFPYGTQGRTASMYSQIDQYGNPTQLWTDSASGLVLKHNMLTPTGILVRSVEWHYDSQTYGPSDLPIGSYALNEPAHVIDRNVTRAFTGIVGVPAVHDMETDDIIGARYLGQQKLLGGIGRACLDGIDAVTQQYGLDPGQTGVPEPPLTMVVAKYDVLDEADSCSELDQMVEPGQPETYESSGSFRVISYDADSTQGSEWASIEVAEAQDHPRSRIPTEVLSDPTAYSNEGGETTAVQDVGAATVIVTGNYGLDFADDIYDELEVVGP